MIEFDREDLKTFRRIKSAYAIIKLTTSLSIFSVDSLVYSSLQHTSLRKKLPKFCLNVWASRVQWQQT
jgi:hypothetical protein